MDKKLPISPQGYIYGGGYTVCDLLTKFAYTHILDSVLSIWTLVFKLAMNIDL